MTIQIGSSANRAHIIDSAGNMIACIWHDHKYSLQFLGIGGVKELPTLPDAPWEDAIKDGAEVVYKTLSEKLKRDTQLLQETSVLMQNLAGPSFKLEYRDQCGRLTF